MKTYFTPSSNLSEFARVLAEADSEGHGMILIFGCDQNEWPTEDFNALMKNTDTPTFGGIFPAISRNEERHETGAVLIGLEERADTALITGMSNPEADYEQQLLDQIEQWDHASTETTLIVLVDGLARRISRLVEDLFFTFGLENNFVGGGAGSLSFEQKPCIITPSGLEVDVALIMKLPRASAIGVTHGWTAISEALEVTEADRNVIKTLNWKPAFEAYKAVVDAHSPSPMDKAAFFDTAKSYPLGLQKLDGEIVVRDPLLVQNESELVCVGEVPQGAFVRILNGNPDSLLEAAREARLLVSSSAAGADNQLLLFDCISRALFLGDGIDDELKALTQGEPSVGAFTLGEIANSGQDYLEFLNKTTVLARLAKPA